MIPENVSVQQQRNSGPMSEYFCFLFKSRDKIHVQWKQSQILIPIKKYSEIYLYKYSHQNKHIYTHIFARCP